MRFMAAASSYEDTDEWEVVNDEGFVYRRKKRQRVDPTATSFASLQQPDPATERRNRRERRRRALLKLRDKYSMEICQWELLSNTLKEMEQRARAQREELNSSISLEGVSSSEKHPAPDPPHRNIIDNLLTQVEAQEAIIYDVSHLCDVAEALCSARDERRKQELLDLPIWDPSPQELMAVLGEPESIGALDAIIHPKSISISGV